jgi:uncharacterized protein
VDIRKQPLLESLTPFTRLLFSILLMIACFAASFLAGLLLAVPLFGVGVGNLVTAMSDYENIKTLRLLEYFQVIQAFGLFIVPALLAGYFFERSSSRFLHLDRLSRPSVYLLSFVLMFVSLPFINWMVTVNEALQFPAFLKDLEAWMKSTEDAAAKLTKAFMNMPTFGGFFFNMLMIALLPAIGEEFMFRGLLQRLLREWLGNIHLAIFIAAFLFSAMHMQFYGFLPRMMLGVMFGYLFYWSGSLWLPVFAHFINNGSAVLFDYLGQKNILYGDYENFGATDNVFFILLSVLIVAALLTIIYKLKPVNHAR